MAQDWRILVAGCARFPLGGRFWGGCQIRAGDPRDQAGHRLTMKLHYIEAGSRTRSRGMLCPTCRYNDPPGAGANAPAVGRT
jgi:hypothetical protein